MIAQPMLLLLIAAVVHGHGLFAAAPPRSYRSQPLPFYPLRGDATLSPFAAHQSAGIIAGSLPAAKDKASKGIALLRQSSTQNAVAKLRGGAAAASLQECDDTDPEESSERDSTIRGRGGGKSKDKSSKKTARIRRFWVGFVGLFTYIIWAINVLPPC